MDEIVQTIWGADGANTSNTTNANTRLFRDTLKMLKDCFLYIGDDLTPQEEKARNKLISVCTTISDEYDNDKDGGK